MSHADATHASPPAPPLGTAERWAEDYVLSRDLEHKLRPPDLPTARESPPVPRRLAAPGRPALLCLRSKAPKSVRPGALQHARRRAQQVHAFLHHELQAAELMCWAFLAFPEAPEAFRTGLLGIAQDEIRHLRMYRAHLERLGHRIGDFGVRDWFWERVPRVRDAADFVGFMGIGLEGGNLDHASEYARLFRAAGDEEGARIQERVCEEEVQHVRFAIHWFREFTGGLSFDAWRERLPPPLSPSLLRRKPLNLGDRRRAGLDEEFLGKLEDT